MQTRKAEADILVPDGVALEKALSRTTHLGIGAHADDLEIMALHGIFASYAKRDTWFTGVTCTDGRGSPRTGVYADYSDADMVRVRQEEQRDAARIGRYSAMLQLMYSSAESKDKQDTRLQSDLVDILRATRPRFLYTHNPADKHPTHIGVLLSVLDAVREMPEKERPEAVYGCEVWRDLDWLPDERKISLDVGGHDNLATALIAVFDSQIAGGKRYDLAAAGRRVANATYLDSHAGDTSQATIFALDLTPVTRNDGPDIADYVESEIEAFRRSVRDAIAAMQRS